MIRLLLVLIGITTATDSYGNKIDVNINKKRLVKLTLPITAKMSIDAANKIYNLSAVDKEAIYVLINSGGGQVFSGELVIDSIITAKNQGIEVVCLVSGMAMSMAFNIFLHCSKHIVFNHSKLMFHPVSLRTSGRFTGEDFTNLSRRLKRMDDRTLNKIREVTGVRRSLIEKWYKEERVFTGKELQTLSKNKWLYIVNKLNGLDKLFD